MCKKLPLEKLFNFRLCLFCAVALCLGIVFGYCIFFGSNLVSILLIVGFLLSLSLYVFIFTTKESRKKSLIFSLVFIVFFLFGFGTQNIQLANYRSADLGNHYYSIQGEIKEVYQTEYGAKYILRDVYIDGNVKGYLSYNVEAYVYGEKLYDLGDIIKFNSYLQDKSFTYDGRFSAYSIEENVKYSVTILDTDITFIKSNPDVFQKVNILIRNNLQAGLSDESFPVAFAMLTGNSDYIDLDTLIKYRQVGVAHIFAVSGLHIGFIALVLNFIFEKLKVRRLTKAIVTVLILVFYAGVCGFTASSLRATIMAAITLFASISGEKYDGVTSVSLSAILLLLINPIQLFCVGFQLSFTVVFGMLILGRPLSKLFSFLPKKLAESIGSVLSAQLFGGVICLAAFKEVSLVAIIANIIFIPVASVIFILMLAIVVLSSLIGCHAVLFFIPEILLKAINFIITVFDYEALIISGITLGGFIIFYYLALIVCSDLVNLSKKLKAISTVVFAIIFLVGSIIYDVDVRKRTYAIVCGSSDICCTVIKSKENNVMVVSNVKTYYSKSRLNRIVKSNNITKIDNLIISGGYGIDIIAFVTGLRTVFELKNVIYYGEEDKLMEISFVKSFPEYTIESGRELDYIDIGKNKRVQFRLNGTLVHLEYANKLIGIFSTFKKVIPEYDEITDRYDLAVITDNAELVYNTIRPISAISYRPSGRMINAETQGNVTFLIG